MRSERTKALIRKIATDESLDIKQVDQIVNSFFRFTAKSMADGDRENLIFNHIRLFKFGVFRVKEAKRQEFKENLKKHEESVRNTKRSANGLSGSTDDQGVQKNMDKGPVTEKGEGS